LVVWAVWTFDLGPGELRFGVWEAIWHAVVLAFAWRLLGFVTILLALLSRRDRHVRS
jgi:hypothetical protein